MANGFSTFFRKATQDAPFSFQEQFATALPSLVSVPTGLGKTAMAVVGWLWRRFGAGVEVCRQTPRRLVYCLPMRVLVEQTRDVANKWRDNLSHAGLLNAKPEVHVLMGGEDSADWDLYPERDAILIGTQDMLLSRALNRGYAAGRARWPMQFGLLHTDCLWVFDEIQLMGSGLATTAQLEAFRRMLPAESADAARQGHGCRSVWMSATMRPEWLDTVDFKSAKARVPNFEPLELGPADHANEQVTRRWTARKPLRKAETVMGDAPSLAAEIRRAHRSGTLTIVVVNTVPRACELHRALARTDGSPEPLLLHSRFRPPDRQRAIDAVLAPPNGAGTIVVSTQVIEAGVDVSATTLFTELAPWASLVQRFGRCNRRGDDNDSASVHWIAPPDVEQFKSLYPDKVRTKEGKPKKPDEIAELRRQHVRTLSLPYAVGECATAEEQLRGLSDVGLASLHTLKVELSYEHTHVIRRKDLIDLFDTTPDLAGNDIDIDRYVRETDDSDVRVFWREWDGDTPPDDKAWRQVGRDELCPASVGDFRDFTKDPKRRDKVWRWDYLDGKWVRPEAIYPGQVYLVHCSEGGYNPHTGWNRSTTAPVALVQREATPAAEEAGDDATDAEVPGAVWQSIRVHTDRVCEELERILAPLAPDALPLETLRAAAVRHDWGKAHPAFIAKLKPEQVAGSTLSEGERQWVGKAPPAAWRSLGELRRLAREPGSPVRPGFRHELASALAVLQDNVPLPAGTDRNLVAYLIAAHHGKVRLSIRSLPTERRAQGGKRFARGVWDGDPLPAIDLGDGEVPGVTLSLEPMELGLCNADPFKDQPSWAERTIRLRDALGPFRLAYIEALLRAADMRASATASAAAAGKDAPRA